MMSKRHRKNSNRNATSRPTTVPALPTDAEELERLPSSVRQRVGMIIQSSMHSGPLPTAEDMAKYAQADPSIPLRIMAMAELEQTERHSFRREVLREQTVLAKRYSWFMLGFLALGCATTLVIVWLTGPSSVAILPALAGVLVPLIHSGAKALSESRTDRSKPSDDSEN